MSRQRASHTPRAGGPALVATGRGHDHSQIPEFDSRAVVSSHMPGSCAGPVALPRGDRPIFPSRLHSARGTYAGCSFAGGRRILIDRAALGRALNFRTPLNPCQDTACDFTQLLGSVAPSVCGLRHAQQIEGVTWNDHRSPMLSKGRENES